MCTARLIPGLPYWPVNYGAGALGISQHVFLSATLVASIPGQVSLVSLGAFAVHQSLFNGIILVTAWMTTLAAIWISYRYWRNKRKESK